MNTKNELLNDAKIEELYSKLRPVVTIDAIKFLLKKYTLEEIKEKPFLVTKKNDKDSYIENSQIEVKGIFDYVKEYTNPFSFNPTISEVLESIPECYIKDANAFEINEMPRVSGNNHIAKVMVYKIH